MTIKPALVKKLNVSSASGLLRSNGKFYVVADDELSLISFSETGGDEPSSIKLFFGELPEDPVERKRLKPDLESMIWISSFSAILALPSGSKPNRNTGALIHLEASGGSRVTRLDFSGLFKILNEKIADLNIEGIVEFGGTIWLFHRGNAKDAVNAVIILQADVFLTELQTGDISAKSFLEIRTCQLGLLNGAPLSFTDAAVWESANEKKVAFLAAAEKTETTYDDGEYRGAIFGVLNEKCEVVFSEELLSPQKPEGLWVENEVFYFVTDADDPERNSELYKFIFS